MRSVDAGWRKGCSRFIERLVASVLICALAFPPSVFAAGIVPDAKAPAGQRPGMGTAANGVPLVNIVSPNQAGLSHNKYSDFNVSGQGAILNNSSKIGVTQLGGATLHNPNMVDGRSAKTILNEVTSSNRSHIEGYIEVFGPKADVILANPNGVTINGGGFLNTNRGVITTGKPMLDAAGNIQSYEVHQGDVSVTGAGINASNLTGFDIISRAAEINADIYAQDLNIVTGANSYDVATGTATPIQGNGASKPKVAIDSSALGGMYAGRITLTSTEKGVGVNLKGLVESQRDLTITADGKLALKNAQSGENVNIKAGNNAVTVDGNVLAGKNISVQGQSVSGKNAALSAEKDVSVQASGNVDFSSQSFISGKGKVAVKADALSLSGDTLMQGENVDVSAKSVKINDSDLLASKILTVTAKSVSVNNGVLQAGSKLVLESEDVSLGDNSEIYSAGSLQLNLDKLGLSTGSILRSGFIDLHLDEITLDSATLMADTDLSLNVLDITSNNGKILAGRDMSLDALNIKNNNGEILSNNDLRINVRDIVNSNGYIAGGRNLTLDALNITNNNGEILSNNDLRITSQNIANNSGYIAGGRDLFLDVLDIANKNGEILSNSDLRINARDIVSSGGYIAGGRALFLDACNITNNNGEILSNSDLWLTARDIVNSNGNISAIRALSLDVLDITNNNGEILANSDLRITASDIVNSGGSITSGKDLFITALDITNNDGEILANNSLKIDASDIVNNDGYIAASHDLLLDVLDIANNGGEILSNSDLLITARDVANNSGNIAASRDLRLDVLNIANNNGEILANNDLWITASNIVSGGGSITAGHDLSITAQDITNTDGEILANSGLWINAWNIINSNGYIAASRDLLLDVRNITNNNGEILANNDLKITARDVANNSGNIAASRDLRLDVLNTANNGGEILANNDLWITASDIVSSGGSISSGHDLSITAQDITNTDGEILANNGLKIKAANIVNSNGYIAASLDLLLDVLNITNNSGEILANNDLRITARNIANSNGNIAAGHDLSITALDMTNNAGEILANNDLEINAADIINSNGYIAASRDLLLNVLNITNNNGEILANRGLRITAHNIANSNGNITAGHDFSITAHDITNNAGEILANNELNIKAWDIVNSNGYIAASLDLLLDVLSVTNNAGEILANRDLRITARDIENKSGGNIASGRDMFLTVQNITNTAGEILSNNDLWLTAWDIVNSNGYIAAANALILNALDITNNTGEILANGDFRITALDIENKSGNIASGQDMFMDVQDIANTDGEILASNDLKITAWDIVNGNGYIAASRALILKARNITNSDGEILANSDLRITALDIANSSGNIAAGHDLFLNVQDITNTGGDILANNDLWLTAWDIISGNGYIAAGHDLSLDVLNITNNHGEILANNDLEITASDIVNSSGNISSGHDLSINALDITNNSGEIQANNDLLITARDITNNNGDIVSGRDLRMTVRDIENKSGNIVADRDLWISAGKFTGAGESVAGLAGIDLGTMRGSLFAGRDLTLSATGDLNLSGGFYGSGNSMGLTGKSLSAKQRAFLYSGNALRLNVADGLSFDGVTLNADGDMDLKGKSLFLANSSSLISGEILSAALSGDATIDFGSALVSYSGLDLQANNLTNRGLIYSAGDGLFRIRGTLANLDSADILTEGNLTLTGFANNTRMARLHNRGAGIESLYGGIKLDANVFDNDGGSATVTVVNDGTTYFSMFVKDSFPGINPDGSYNRVWNSGDTTGSSSQSYGWREIGAYVAEQERLYGIPNSGGSDHFQEWVASSHEEIGSSPTPAYFMAGGNMVLNVGDLNNTLSTISAGGNMLVNANKLTNSGVDLYAFKNIYRWHLWSGSHGEIEGHAEASYDMAEVYASVPSIITAGGVLQLNIAQSLNNSVMESAYGYVGKNTSTPGFDGFTVTGNLRPSAPSGPGAPTVSGPGVPGISGPGVPSIPSGPGVTGGPSVPSGSGGGGVPSVPSGSGAGGVPSVPSGPGATGVPSVPGVAGVPGGSSGSQRDILSDIRLGSLFKVNTNPSHPYAIETNPALATLNKFYGSEYFLSAMGLNLGAMEMKLLGDSFFELKFVRQQILDQTGQRYLVPGLDDGQMLQLLMDNAVAAGQSLGLTVGVSLSADQIKNLSKDIVWLEEQEYQGQKVLVPHLYLADSTRAELTVRGSVISGDQVIAQVGGQGASALFNSGLIRGNDVQLVSVGDIVNKGGEIVGKNTLLVQSDGSIINRSGSLKGGDIALVAGKDISIETLVEQRRSGGSNTALMHQVAEVNATGSLTMRAGNDIALKGARVSAGGLAALSAGNDINILSKSATISGDTGNIRSSRTNQLGSSIQSGDLAVQAGRDISVIGSSLKADNDAALQAGRNLTVAAAEGSRESYLKFGGSGSYEAVHQNESTGLVQSTISVGGNLSLKAGTDASQGAGNLTFIASQANAKGDVSLNASGDVILAAGQESSYQYDSRKGSKALSSFSEMQASGSLTNVGSSISGNNVSINAGENVLIVGSSVRAENDLGVKAEKGDIVVAAVQDTNWSKEEKKKSKVNLENIIGFDMLMGATSGFALPFVNTEFASKTTEKGAVSNALNAGSLLTAGNNMKLDAGRDVSVIGSALDAGNDLGLFAGRDVNLIPGREQSSAEYSKRKESIGVNSDFTLENISQFGGYKSVEQGVQRTGDYTAGSYVGAGNDVVISAGRDVNQAGSHIEAGRDVVIDAGRDWNMLASYDHETLSQYVKEVQAGITGSLRQNVSDTAKTFIDLPADMTAGRGGAGYSAVTAGSAGLKAYNSAASTASETASASATAGASHSESRYEQATGIAVPSTVSAGRDIIATTGRDINIQGGQISAAGDIVFDAARDVNITPAQNFYDSHFSSQSTSAGAGLKAAVGSGGAAAGINVQAQADGSGNKGHGYSNLNSVINAGDLLSITSGRDTNISGSHLAGDKVWLDVGRDLTVASTPDSFESSGYSWGAGGSVTVGYGVAVSGNLSGSKSDSNSNLVGGQTSIFGKSEVDIYVGKHTQIDGAIINSGNGNLTLNTETLGFSDITGRDKGENIGGGISGGTTVGGGFSQGSTLGGLPVVDNTSGTQGTGNYLPGSGTFDYSSHDKEQINRATVGEGTIIVRSDPDKDLSGLNRDPNKAQEITKDDQTNMHVYVNPSVIADIANGGKGLINSYTELAKQVDGLVKNVTGGSADTSGSNIKAKELDDKLKNIIAAKKEELEASGIKDPVLLDMLAWYACAKDVTKYSIEYAMETSGGNIPEDKALAILKNLQAIYAPLVKNFGGPEADHDGFSPETAAILIGQLNDLAKAGWVGASDSVVFLWDVITNTPEGQIRTQKQKQELDQIMNAVTENGFLDTLDSATRKKFETINEARLQAESSGSLSDYIKLGEESSFILSLLVGTSTGALKAGGSLDAVVAKVREEVSGNVGIKEIVNYSPINPGPLPNKVASSFRSGHYSEVLVSEPMTLYRVYGGTAGEIGSYWTPIKPSGPTQAVIDLALKPEWGNTASNITTIQVPAGTKMYQGIAAQQGNLTGGGVQIYIQNVKPSWRIR